MNMRFLRALVDRIQRYPVLFFGAVAAWLRSKIHIETGTADDVALTATVLWLQSAFSVSKTTHDESIEAAKYIGAIEEKGAAMGVAGSPPESK